MAGSILGNAVLRVEDPRFLAGEARYVENIALEGARHAVFVRSFLAHARVNGIDATQARTMPGVSGVWTAGDLELSPMGVMESVGEGFARPVLARDVVRVVGGGEVAEALALEEDRVHVIAPDVGGGFGAKGDTYPEWIALAAIAMRTRGAVRYTETRSENLSAMVHGRAQIQDVEIGARRDGTI